jgi:replicative DNA helicase
MTIELFEENLSDLAAERAVLIGLFQYGIDAYIDVSTLIDVDTFTDIINQTIYKCVQYMCDKKDMKNFDQSSFFACLSEIGHSNLIEKKNDIQFVRSIMNGRVLLENVRTWAAQIRKLQIGRLLRDRLKEASIEVNKIKGTESIESILGIAENTLLDFTSLLQGEECSNPCLIGDGIEEFVQNIESNPVDIIGISSGMPYYDQAIGGGFRRKTVSLISARPKTGKSIMSANIGLHVSKNIGIPVLYLDTEMTKEDHWARLIPNICYDLGAKVTIDEIERGSYINNGFIKQKVREAISVLSGDNPIPFHYLSVAGKPFEEILSIMRRWVTKTVGQDEYGNTKDCLIIYDYFKTMSGDGINDSIKEYQLLGFMMTSLHNFVVRHNVPVLSFAQSNRGGINSEETDIISGSDRILWLVTNYTIYKEKTEEEIVEAGAENGNRKLIPKSARHGEGIASGDYINLHFYGKYGKIIEGETKSRLRAESNSQTEMSDE